MKAEFLTDNIISFIPLLAKALPHTSPVPVLLNVLIEAESTGIFLSATDLELGIRVKIPAKIDEVGAVTVPGKQFIEIMNSLPKGKVSLVQEKDAMVISSSGGNVTLQTIPREEFPNLFEEKGEKVHTFSLLELKNIFSKVIFSTSTEDSRIELTGIYLSQKEGHMDVVATDGYRLSLKRIPNATILPVDTGIIISAKFIAEALSLKEEAIDMYVYSQGNQVIFQAGELTLVGRPIHGNFPNYERVIPENGATAVGIDTDDLLQAVKLVGVFAKESANIMRVKISEKRMNLVSRSSGVGEGDVFIDVEQKGDDNGIAFNVKFVLDLLRNIDDKRLTLQLNSPLEPAVFTSEKDKEFLHVIMPVRVQE